MEERKSCCEKQNQEEVKRANPQPKYDSKNAKWEKPTLEDVSGKVMAQPYIRFT